MITLCLKTIFFKNRLSILVESTMGNIHVKFSIYTSGSGGNLFKDFLHLAMVAILLFGAIRIV